ncbi:MAG: hypothetical protein HY805_09780 [Nitrospirae bacterium]|nr:hypothetical protein [Nitrospirota bacterium]
MCQIPSDLRELVDNTTIVKLEDSNNKVLIGDPNYCDSRFQSDHQRDQINLNDLEPFWNKKFQTFQNNWKPQRQNYIFFYNTFKLFYYSFYQLRVTKVASINVDRNCSGYRQKIVLYSELAGTGLCGIYQYGKKCIDIISKLRISINKPDEKFFKKFSGTRNKIIEHNFNLNNYSFQIDPDFWSLLSTDSWLTVLIHTSKEAAYRAQIDYYEDYYKLEKFISEIIRLF